MARTSWYLTETLRFTGRRLRVDGQGKPIRDRYNNEQYDDVDFDVPGCSWEPRMSVGSENVEAAQQVVSGMTVICDDPDAPVTAQDACTIDGLKYEVDGEVGRFRGSRMGNDQAVIVLRRVTG